MEDEVDLKESEFGWVGRLSVIQDDLPGIFFCGMGSEDSDPDLYIASTNFLELFYPIECWDERRKGIAVRHEAEYSDWFMNAPGLRPGTEKDEGTHGAVSEGRVVEGVEVRLGAAKVGIDEAEAGAGQGFRVALAHATGTTELVGEAEDARVAG